MVVVHPALDVSQAGRDLDKGFCLQTTVAWDAQSRDLEALVDSGAEANFISQDLVAKLGIPTQSLPFPMESFSGDCLCLSDH